MFIFLDVEAKSFDQLRVCNLVVLHLWLGNAPAITVLLHVCIIRAQDQGMEKRKNLSKNWQFCIALSPIISKLPSLPFYCIHNIYGIRVNLLQIFMVLWSLIVPFDTKPLAGNIVYKDSQHTRYIVYHLLFQ